MTLSNVEQQHRSNLFRRAVITGGDRGRSANYIRYLVSLDVLRCWCLVATLLCLSVPQIDRFYVSPTRTHSSKIDRFSYRCMAL